MRPETPGASARAVSAWVETTSLAFAGTTSVVLAATGWQIRIDQPAALLLDLSTKMMTVRLDAPGATQARLSLTLEGDSQNLVLTDSLTIPLAAHACALLQEALTVWLTTLRPVLSAPVPVAVTGASTGWTRVWTYDAGSRRPECVRNFCVTANPLPTDASPDQLLDPVMPDGYS